ncbi:AP2 domain-containing protein [Streptomyces sp. NPDC056309]|uniref:AP2 domain-containing protein n=1 Tax=Streptomyces sp. NPDC056309 TaxID=3345781 RepID=UPI0035D56891
MARKAEAYIGARFGRLTVVGEAVRGQSKRGKPYIGVRCDCGSEKTIRISTLGTNAKSCGCLNSEVSSARSRTHGMRDSSEYAIWTSMKQRCLNPAHRRYENYGGRGITVCPRWQTSFEAFLADMGPRPSKDHTLDRLDNDRGYEPGNVAWRTYREQAANRRPQLRETCAKGHPRTPENVHVRPDGGRTCRVCDRDRPPRRERRTSSVAAPDTEATP